MSDRTPEFLTDEHLVRFGMIVRCFARHEVLMARIMAAVSGADVTSIRLLTGGLSFTEKREALFNLLRHRAVPLDQIEQIRNCLQMPRTHDQLRNDIMHSTLDRGQAAKRDSAIMAYPRTHDGHQTRARYRQGRERVRRGR